MVVSWIKSTTQIVFMSSKYASFLLSLFKFVIIPSECAENVSLYKQRYLCDYGIYLVFPRSFNRTDIVCGLTNSVRTDRKMKLSPYSTKDNSPAFMITAIFLESAHWNGYRSFCILKKSVCDEMLTHLHWKRGRRLDFQNRTFRDLPIWSKLFRLLNFLLNRIRSVTHRFAPPSSYFCLKIKIQCAWFSLWKSLTNE